MIRIAVSTVGQDLVGRSPIQVGRVGNEMSPTQRGGAQLTGALW